MQRRITIVDDEGGVRIALQRLLNVVGIKTQGYASAEDFLEAIPGLRCDCLILDHGLPGMSGLELQSRLTATHPRLPIIFISAHDDPHIRSQAMQAGALAFLGKPFGDEGLLRLVEKALQSNKF